jgi:hypothetical protein
MAQHTARANLQAYVHSTQTCICSAAQLDLECYTKRVHQTPPTDVGINCLQQLSPEALGLLSSVVVDKRFPNQALGLYPSVRTSINHVTSKREGAGYVSSAFCQPTDLSNATAHLDRHDPRPRTSHPANIHFHPTRPR